MGRLCGLGITPGITCTLFELFDYLFFHFLKIQFSMLFPKSVFPYCVRLKLLFYFMNNLISKKFPLLIVWLYNIVSSVYCIHRRHPVDTLV